PLNYKSAHRDPQPTAAHGAAQCRPHACEARRSPIVAMLRPAPRCPIRRAMMKPPAPRLILLVSVLSACTAAKPHHASRLEWQKSSDFAPGLEDARQNCKVQAAAQTLGMPQGSAVVGEDFVKCMHAAGWTLVDHGAE